MTFASSLPYSDAERRADARSVVGATQVPDAKALVFSCPSGQRYDQPFDPAAHKRLQRKLGERD